jgi:hypothetical protein
MSTVPLGKPSTVTGAILTFASGSGIGSATGNFRIKTQRIQSRIGSPTQDVTGDGDTNPCYANNGWLYGQFRLEGFMVSGAAMGVANIINDSNNPTVEMTFNLSSGRFIKSKVIVEGFTYDANATAPVVGVILDCRSSDDRPKET